MGDATTGQVRLRDMRKEATQKPGKEPISGSGQASAWKGT